MDLYLTSHFLSSVNVHMPKDRVTQTHQGYGFVEFMGEEDADYAIKIMNMIKLYGKPIRVNKVRNLLYNFILIGLQPTQIISTTVSCFIFIFFKILLWAMLI